MSILTFIHLLAAAYSIGSGALVLRNRKGTVLHTWLGRSFVAAMVATDLTAFMFVPEYGFTWLAALAALNLAYILIGLWFALARRGKLWVVNHFYFLTYAFLGVVAAAVGRVPLLVTPSVDLAALVSIIVVFGVGVPLVERTGKRLRVAFSSDAQQVASANAASPRG